MTRADMPVALRQYVLAVVVGGPLAAVAAASGGFEGVGLGDWGRASLLVLLAALAYDRPFQVGHKYSYDVSEVIHLAMILLFPTSLPGLLVLLAASLRLVRRPKRPIDEYFNVGQLVLHVTTGALCLAAIRDGVGGGPALAGLPPVGPIVVAAGAMLLVNTALVAGAIALDSGARFWRLWRGEIANVAGTSAALFALGVVAALIVRDYPLALLPLAIPAGLAQYALRRETQLRAETRAALASLVDVMELQDPYTAGHSGRVATLARNLALRLGLTGEEADLVETAGRVHDLGKLALKPALLHKQGPLDEAEWREMRQHPVHGAEVVGRFAGYAGCAELVRHHHEHLDGSGYPCGLAGDQIPIGARILAVADAFDAMTTTRSYRPAKGPDAALRVLEEGAGTRWDRRVVDALAEQQRAAAPAAVPVAARPLEA
jgi:hypothetical protein